MTFLSVFSSASADVQHTAQKLKNTIKVCLSIFYSLTFGAVSFIRLFDGVLIP